MTAREEREDLGLALTVARIVPTKVGAEDRSLSSSLPDQQLSSESCATGTARPFVADTGPCGTNP